MAEPSDNDIKMLVDCTTLHPSEAIKWLKAHKNDVASATNAFLDNPNLYPYSAPEPTWDENAFHSDKTDRNQPAFTVNPQDTLKPSVFSSAPSRPPSRVSVRPSLSISQTRTSISNPQEARDLDQALKMSMMNQDDHASNQMTGVTHASATYFGPATQEHYDRNWALTIPRDYTKEIWLNPEPVDRKRGTNKPAFLRPSTQPHRLPALIKILQAIPLTREAMLCAGNILADYGHESEWWDGTSIKVPQVFLWDHANHDQDAEWVVHEIQRLVAFLEETERAYGSTDSLMNTWSMARLKDDEVLPGLFKTWEAACENMIVDLELHKVVESVGTKRNPDEPQLAEDHSFTTLQLRIDEEIADRGHTLYDAVDDILWTMDDLQGGQPDVYFEKVGDVFILEVKRADEARSGLGIKIPAVWYLDRYLKSSIVAVKEMRATKAAIQKELDAIEQRRVKVADYRLPGVDAGVIDGLSLLNIAGTYFERSAASVRTGQARQQTSSAASPVTLRDPEKVAKELRVLSEKIAQKLKTFEDSKKCAIEKLEEVSKLYTKAAPDSDDPPHYKYTLRGVCSDPKTVYVLEKTQPDVEDDILSTEAKDWQWWKITYIGSDSKPVSVSKVREIEVLKAARDESNSALLVYASDEAVTYQTESLPSALRNFIRLDNLSFTAELEKSSPSKPMTPKRKADEAENDDLEQEYYASAPLKRNGEISSSRALSETNLPLYVTDLPSPPLSTSDQSRTPTHHTEILESYDNVIPLSLRGTPTTIDPSVLLERNGRHSAGQEMEDRGGMMGIVQQGNGNRNHGYALGSYVPEIIMDDPDADGEDEATSKVY